MKWKWRLLRSKIALLWLLRALYWLAAITLFATSVFFGVQVLILSITSD